MRDLQSLHIPLRGFGGAEVRSLGTVKLLVEIGMQSCQKAVLLDFVMVDIENWPYNALLGRLFLNKSISLTTTYVLMVKFPSKLGIDVMRGSQEWAKQVNLAVYKDRAYMEFRDVNMIEEKCFEIDEEKAQVEAPSMFDLNPREESSEVLKD